MLPMSISKLVEYFEYFGEKAPEILVEYLADPYYSSRALANVEVLVYLYSPPGNNNNTY